MIGPTLQRRRELQTLEEFKQLQCLHEYITSTDYYEMLVNTIKVVNEFPLNRISEGDSFTFSNSIAKTVTDYTHGIHTYPAKFIPQIPRWALRYAKISRNEIVLDPFVGCGTTLVEAKLNGVNSYGVEVNPLGRLLSEVKSNPLLPENPSAIFEYSEQLLFNVCTSRADIDIEAEINDQLPAKWSFWFQRGMLEDLLRIKKQILDFQPSTLVRINDSELELLKKFYLVNLSSIIKKASYFDESQIKVRKKADKFKNGYPNVIGLFKDALEKNQKSMCAFSKAVGHDRAFAKVIGDDARKIDLDNESVDLIVTSPPYINAIDYPMAHKYNLFLLGLVHPNNYKEHCRKYAGMTERAVSTKDYNKINYTGLEEIDRVISTIYKKNSATDKNRAYILFQYFCSMRASLEEAYRVLKSDANCIIVVGDNRIRGEYVSTARFLERIAEQAGFSKVVAFKHYYKNIRLKINRNTTGGKINFENVLILRKP